jgi:uncharacterized membrane protein HdeD (DUF308 family)
LGEKILRLAPGFEASFNPFVFALASIATLAWFFLFTGVFRGNHRFFGEQLCCQVAGLFYAGYYC